MTVKELYKAMCEVLPDTLREPWDNDGLMCCPDGEREVSRVLLALDVTEEIMDYAIENGMDLIVSHHPLIFKPLSRLVAEDHIGRKLIELVQNNISVFSFHTRADKAEGGVNDILASLMKLEDVRPFGEGDLGRIGKLPETITLEDLCYLLKDELDAPFVLTADAYNPVETVAFVGGEGRDFIRSAIAAGADTLVSGRLGYHQMEDAPEMGINLIEAGHFFTEHPVLDFFESILHRIDPTLTIQKLKSNVIGFVC